MEFDIHREPPTAEQVAKERERIKKLHLRELTVSLVGLVGFFLCFGSSFLLGRSLIVNAAPGGKETVLSFVLILLGLISFVVGFCASLRMKDYHHQFAKLGPICRKSKMCLDIMVACEANKECDSYTAAIAKCERLPVFGEAEAIIAWHKDHERQPSAEDAYSRIISGENLWKGNQC